MTQIWFFWLSGNVFSWGCCFIWQQGLLWKDILSFPRVIIITCYRFEKKHEFSIENYQFGFFVIVLFCLQYLIICIVRIIIDWTVICRFFDRFIPQLTTLPIRYQKLTLISQQDGCLKSHVTATFLLGSTVTICNTRFRELFFKLTTTFLLTTIGNGCNWKISFSDSCLCSEKLSTDIISGLTLEAPISQMVKHTNNSSTNCRWIVWVWPFYGIGI